MCDDYTCVRMYVRASVHACMHVCVRRACVCVHVRVRARACVAYPEVSVTESLKSYVRRAGLLEHLLDVLVVVDVGHGVVQGGHDEGGVVLEQLVLAQLVLLADVLEVLEQQLHVQVGLEEPGTEREVHG